jgi:hypothetical protein
MLMKEVYDRIYFKEEKKRIRKELLEKENIEKERINKIKQRWDEVFTLDHKFYFNKRSWEIFRRQKPIILHKFKWIKVDESSKWKNLYKQEGIINKNPCWKNLFEEKQVGTIHFINKEICNRSNTEYYRRLIEYNFIDNDLDLDLQLMERDFKVEEEFQLEEHPRFHQLFCHQCLQKTQQQLKEFQEQTHKLDEECHKLPSHIHIVYPIPRGSNLLPKYSEYKNNRQVKFQQLEAVSSQAK